MAETASVVIDIMAEAYPHLVERRDEILGVIAREEAQFARTLDSGTGLLEAELEQLDGRPSASSAGGRTPCRRMRRSCRATSPSSCTTRTGSRST